MVNFFHFTDIHIPDKRGDLFHGIDPFQKLDEKIENTKKLNQNPAFTIITGDVSHTGPTQSYHNVKEYISKIQALGGPVIPTMGTKDSRRNFKQIILVEETTQEEPACYYSKTIEGIHIIAMDSHTPRSNIGSFSPKQLECLGNELREHEDTPSIIAFHEPIYFFGKLGLFNKEDSLRFRDIFSTGNVLAVLNGHLHCPMYNVIDGVYYIQAGSPFWVNYWNDADKTKTYEISSFNLISYYENHLGRVLI